VVLLSAGDLARLAVEDPAGDGHRRDLFLEEPVGLGAGRALLREERVLVLGLAPDPVALGHHLGRVAHDHVDPRVMLLDPGVRARVPLEHRDRLDPAADRRVGPVVHDVVGGHCHRLQARRAEAVHRRARHRHREARAEGRHPRHVVALGAVGLTTPEDHVLDLRVEERRNLGQHVPDGVGGELVGARQVEGTAERLGKRRPGTGDHDGLSHDLSPVGGGFLELYPMLG
jgi:hypothetical protein